LNNYKKTISINEHLLPFGQAPGYAYTSLDLLGATQININ